MALAGGAGPAAHNERDEDAFEGATTMVEMKRGAEPLETTVTREVVADQVRVERSAVAMVRAQSAEVTQGAVGLVLAGGDVQVSRGGGRTFVAGGDLNIAQGGGGMFLAGGDA
jgi:hypothetical protein